MKLSIMFKENIGDCSSVGIVKDSLFNIATKKLIYIKEEKGNIDSTKIKKNLF